MVHIHIVKKPRLLPNYSVIHIYTMIVTNLSFICDFSENDFKNPALAVMDNTWSKSNIFNDLIPNIYTVIGQRKKFVLCNFSVGKCN